MSAMHGRQPPRFVPTLTDIVPDPVVQISRADVNWARSNEAGSGDTTNAVAVLPLEGSESIHERFPCSDVLEAQIMSHLDAVLSERLQVSMLQAVEQQAQHMYTLMRPQIEQVVRDAVAQALEQQQAAATA